MSLILAPAVPVEGGALTARLDGPFPQPAPQIFLQVQGDQIIARVQREDFVIPNLPPVSSAQATIPAPPAGAYVLIERACGGNPPPPSPRCTTVSQQSIVVGPAFSVPATGSSTLLALALGVAAPRLNASSAP